MAIVDPFAGTVPSRVIWVSPGGSNANSGAEGAPLQTIQAAVDKAKGQPGTAIMVKAGTYNENVKLNGLHGTPDKPILLVSADGPQAAKIVGGPSAATITGYGVSNLGIKGFHVVSNTAEGDIGGFKLWGGWDNPAHNLVVTGNLITGRGQDGFKLFGGAKNNLVLGNTIDGAWRQEAIDNVSVEDTVYAYNTLRGSAGYTGITMKAGSRDMQVIGNDIDIDAGTAVFVGGFGNSRLSRSFPDYWEGFEARNVTVEGNRLDANGKSVNFVGANNSTVEGNHLADPVGSVNHTVAGYFSYDSFDNTVVGNSVAKADFIKPSSGQSKGYTVSGNVVGGAAPSAGAGLDHVKAFVVAFGTGKGGSIPGDSGPILVPAEPTDPTPQDPGPGDPSPAKWDMGGQVQNTVKGTSKADTLDGTARNDRIDGGSGADRMRGGAGDDVYVIGNVHDVVEERAGEGIDTALAWVKSHTLAAHVENLEVRLASGGSYAGNALDNVMTGGAGDDRLDGAAGDDLLRGGGGADTFAIAGGQGSDAIADFGNGADKVELSKVAYGSAAQVLAGLTQVGADVVLDIGNGETLTFLGKTASSFRASHFELTGAPAPAPSTPTAPAPAPVEQPQAPSSGVPSAGDLSGPTAQKAASTTLSPSQANLVLTGTGAFSGTGNAKSNALVGNGAGNLLSGKDGDDALYGAGGDDGLLGGNGKDRLDGGAGDDTLVGGWARDVLLGGAGSDRFVCEKLDHSRPGAARDAILDFSRDEGDRIDLSRIDAGAKASGNQAFSFIGAGPFTGKAGQLHFVAAQGGVVVEADVNGDRVADLQIEVHGVGGMVAADFVL
jgi:Ca2+-binding RTX toxin-like protein